MTAYRVILHGCDDATYIDIDLTDDEAATIRRLSAASEESSSYGCEPVMTIEQRGADA